MFGCLVRSSPHTHSLQKWHDQSAWNIDEQYASKLNLSFIDWWIVCRVSGIVSVCLLLSCTTKYFNGITHTQTNKHKYKKKRWLHFEPHFCYCRSVILSHPRFPHPWLSVSEMELIACNSLSIVTSLALASRHQQHTIATKHFLNDKNCWIFFPTGLRVRQQSTATK